MASSSGLVLLGEDQTSQKPIVLSEYDSLPALLKARLTTPLSARTSDLLNALEKQTPHPDLSRPAPSGLLLCPIVALSKFPYKFAARNVSQQIANGWFDAGKFWKRTWHIFYAWPTPSISNTPVLLVPFSQFEALLAEINSTLQMGLAVNYRDRQNGLVIELPDHPDLAPRFLGTSISRDAFDRLKASVPDRRESSGSYSVTMRAAFTDVMVKAMSIAKGYGPRGSGSASYGDAARAERKKREQMVKRKEYKSHLVEAERMLGLRPAAYVKSDNTALGTTVPWAEQVKVMELESALSKASIAPAPIDQDKPVPFPFEGSVIFVAIDLEWYERNSSIVTEIGISTLDTADLIGVAPGKHARHWGPKIRARHFRIFEHRNYRNSFSDGDPERFEFGESAMIRLDEAPQVIAGCFKPPYSASNPRAETLEQQRKVVLVGHDIGGDLAGLKALGYDVTNLSTLHSFVLDTALLYRALTHDTQTAALGKVVSQFDFVPWNLHNAGNDAYYTMQAMLGIAMCNATEKRAEKAPADSSRGTGYSSDEGW